MEMVKFKIFIEDIVQTTNRNGSENYSGKRVARQKEMNIITLEPENGKSIPVYSKGTKERDEMLESYYRNCEIRRKEVLEGDLETLTSEN